MSRNMLFWWPPILLSASQSNRPRSVSLTPLIVSTDFPWRPRTSKRPSWLWRDRNSHIRLVVSHGNKFYGYATQKEAPQPEKMLLCKGCKPERVRKSHCDVNLYGAFGDVYMPIIFTQLLPLMSGLVCECLIKNNHKHIISEQLTRQLTWKHGIDYSSCVWHVLQFTFDTIIKEKKEQQPLFVNV